MSSWTAADDVERGGGAAAAADRKAGKTMEMLQVMSSRRLNGAGAGAPEGGPQDARGVEVAFVDVSYTVRDRMTRRDKAILDGVTGMFRPGSMTALMGPSGCGKTTLLDVLSGRKTTGQIRGEILYNGVEPTAALLKTRCGYVEQFDTLVPNLTVREMLLYTAHLKRETSETFAEKLERVEAVMTALRLQEARDVPIGDPLTKGISGGQAKRVSIGLALISQPEVLFLDEPTTGLDSFMANEVMSILRELCSAMEITVCATIHSPTAYCFSQFDELLMLIGGKVAFNGAIGRDAQHVCDFFERQGYRYPQTMNYSVVEWLVDVVSGGYELTSQSFSREGRQAPAATNGPTEADGAVGVASSGEEVDDHYSFAGYYRKSSMCRRKREDVEASVYAFGSGFGVGNGAGEKDRKDKSVSSHIITTSMIASQPTTVPERGPP